MLSLLLVAVLAVGILLVTTLGPGPESNTMGYEVARTSLQVLGVVLAGALVGMATYTLQQEQRRTVDERERLDERVRAAFDATIDAYNEVKFIRRLLRAETGPKATPSITDEAYTRLLPELCKQQLAFEELKRSAPLIQTALENGAVVPDPVNATLEDTYDAIEHYLNDVVEEFEDTRCTMPPTDPRSLQGPDKSRLARFVYDTSSFRASVSRPVTAVLRHLEQHLLTPSR